MSLKNKTMYSLITNNAEEIQLYLAQEIQSGGSSQIIVYESATGNGGTTYNNGRLQEDITITGKIVGTSPFDVASRARQIERLRILGEVVELKRPYMPSYNKTNKYYIKDFTPTQNRGTYDLSFSLTLTEYRESNVQTIAVNLVNFEAAELMRTYYNELVGNV